MRATTNGLPACPGWRFVTDFLSRRRAVEVSPDDIAEAFRQHAIRAADHRRCRIRTRQSGRIPNLRREFAFNSLNILFGT
jgi:hypothetical protein